MKNKIYCKNQALMQIEDLIEYAWKQTIKYRYDPFIGRIHQDYLKMIKETKNLIKEDHEINHALSNA